QGRDPGFRSEGVLTMTTSLPLPQYAKVITRQGFYTRVAAEVRAMPGVVNAAFVSSLPLGKMRGGIWPVSLDGRPANPAETQNAFLRYATPGYFAPLGIPLKSGRAVAAADTFARKPFVALISESFVKRFWPDQTPASVLGRSFNFALADRVVIGVVG